jgi:hypothetical protein
MNKEVIHQAAIAYAEKSFVYPLNKEGEPLSIPAGQTVPYGYRKHCKIAEKHFKAGVAWYKEVEYIKTEKPATARKTFHIFGFKFYY